MSVGNKIVEYSVQIGMRGKAVWLKMLTLFVFVMAQMPTSAIASLFTKSCGMPCCQAMATQPAHDPAEMVNMACHDDTGSNDHCNSTLDEHEKQSAAASRKDDCKCQISPATPPDLPTVVLDMNHSSVQLELDTAILTPTALQEFAKPELWVPGIFGFDSGPPMGRPYCAWSGRAPPVQPA